MNDFFKPEDFINIYKQVMKMGYQSNHAGDMWEPDYRPEDIAKEVNAKLQSLIDAAPTVYGSNPSPYWYIEGEAEFDKNLATKKAKLLFIEELKKEPCVHEPYQTNDNIILTTMPPKLPEPEYACRKCNVKLKATWSEEN